MERVAICRCDKPVKHGNNVQPDAVTNDPMGVCLHRGHLGHPHWRLDTSQATALIPVMMCSKSGTLRVGFFVVAWTQG